VDFEGREAPSDYFSVPGCDLQKLNQHLCQPGTILRERTRVASVSLLQDTFTNVPQPLPRRHAPPSSWLLIRKDRTPRRFSTFDPLEYKRPLCPFTLLCQNEFKSAISERIRKCAPGRGVAPHAAELSTISQQFASPDTKGRSHMIQRR
jgi:hypothetical protein